MLRRRLISSFAVVASLWYLAIQVHRSTRVVKLTAQDAAASAYVMSQSNLAKMPSSAGFGGLAWKISTRFRPTIVPASTMSRFSS